MEHSKLSKFHVLIVDDETSILGLVHDVLTELGFTNVVIARGGKKAIEYLQEHKFDFIITDWRMPDFTGIELVHFIRTSPASLNPLMPVIMLTGNTEAHEVMAARDAGIDTYLIKPFTAGQLVQHIRTIIEKPKEFVASSKYTGPSRRHHEESPPGGFERRRSRKDQPE